MTAQNLFCLPVLKIPQNALLLIPIYYNWGGISIMIFYYPLQAIFDVYPGIYEAGYIFFIHISASVPWIISVNNFRIFINISEAM